MKKILLSILAIALTVGTVSASAYALFSETVKIGGITISSGDADLVVRDGDASGTIIESGVDTGLSFTGLYPGFRDYGKFTFENRSKSKIGLDLTARLVSAGGHWGDLKDNVYAAVGTGTKDDPHFLTSWISLNDWNASPQSLGIPTLNPDTVGTYNIYIYIPSTVGNSIAGKTISDLAFEIYATQH